MARSLSSRRPGEAENAERNPSFLRSSAPSRLDPSLHLGIVADEISRDFADAVRIGLPLGLRRYEIRNLKSGRAPMCDEAELLEVERIAAAEGVEITALSPGLFKFTETAEAFRTEMAEVYPRAADLAKGWNLPGLIVFGFHKGVGADSANPDEDRRKRLSHQWLLEARDRAAEDGLLLMVEPEPICCIDTARGAAALGVRINYDPGNVAWLTGHDPIDEFEAAAPSISNVHIKNLRLPGPEWLPAGEGIIDYRRHFAALQRAGYAGPISLEPHMEGSPEAIRRCRDAVLRLWESAQRGETQCESRAETP
ncbi:MAG TPA: sugar phosphate isomerase/epimerase [Bryobacteraceae bacterium]|nr:sugar phosphate isomerase/epimerase [Bryobacteraceae bacterium]